MKKIILLSIVLFSVLCAKAGEGDELIHLNAGFLFQSTSMSVLDGKKSWHMTMLSSFSARPETVGRKIPSVARFAVSLFGSTIIGTEVSSTKNQSSVGATQVLDCI